MQFIGPWFPNTSFSEVQLPMSELRNFLRGCIGSWKTSLIPKRSTLIAFMRMWFVYGCLGDCYGRKSAVVLDIGAGGRSWSSIWWRNVTWLSVLTMTLILYEHELIRKLVVGYY